MNMALFSENQIPCVARYLIFLYIFALQMEQILKSGQDQNGHEKQAVSTIIISRNNQTVS